MDEHILGNSISDVRCTIRVRHVKWWTWVDRGGMYAKRTPFEGAAATLKFVKSRVYIMLDDGTEVFYKARHNVAFVP